jgi:RNA polymerase sigma factor (sigma-70 family)
MAAYSDDDPKLWQAFQQGDSSALGILAERYYRSLRKYGLKFIQEVAVVEDCIQDVFLELGQDPYKLNVNGSLKYYLMKALRNNIFLHLRYRQRFQNPSPDWELSLPDDFNAEALLIEKERISDISTQLDLVLESLPKREREALYLRYYENLSVAEIAGIMDVNRQSVSNFLQKALSKIRAKWVTAMMLILNLF